VSSAYGPTRRRRQLADPEGNEVDIAVALGREERWAGRAAT
jgi:hypothetical protein